jgi:hypothetical protein
MEESRLGELHKGVLRKMCGLNDKVTKKCSKLCNEELHDVHSSRNVILGII